MTVFKYATKSNRYATDKYIKINWLLLNLMYIYVRGVPKCLLRFYWTVPIKLSKGNSYIMKPSTLTLSHYSLFFIQNEDIIKYQLRYMKMCSWNDILWNVSAHTSNTNINYVTLEHMPRNAVARTLSVSSVYNRSHSQNKSWLHQSSLMVHEGEKYSIKPEIA